MSESHWQDEVPWGIRTEMVFLSVDIIGHSRLFRGDLSNRQMTAVHDFLHKLRTFVEECIPEFATRKDLEWDWASDGGIFAFPSSAFSRTTTSRAVDCAVAIWSGLPDFAKRLGIEVHEIGLHISLDRGQAYVVEDRQMRHSDALNVAAKLKSPTGQTAILVTQRICDDLPQERVAKDFRRQEPLVDGTAVFAYLPALQRGMQELAMRHANEGRLMDAAHCLYRQGRYLAAGGEMEEAAEAFRRAVETADGVSPGQRHRYFFRTLRELYVAWSGLTSLGVPCDYPSSTDFFAHEQVQELFRSSPEWSMRANLITDFELISEQLDLLCAKFINTPSGLSTLQAAVLLQRVGYSSRYFGGALGRRLDRVELDLKANHNRSIDGDCSMCSGAALSALSLAGRSERASEIREWLRRLGPDRYCVLRRDYTDAKYNEHALHYAASVLQGFLDTTTGARSGADAEVEDDIAQVVRVFFERTETGERNFPKHWMRYRNIDAYEVCNYILPVFARYLLSGRPLNGKQRAQLSGVVDALAGGILGEASNPAHAGRLYVARENVGSLSLGLMVGMSIVAEKVARDALGLFTRRAEADYPERGSTTLDSNIDRTRRFLEGWLLHWEVVLHPSANPPRSYVKDLLLTYPRPRPS